MKKGDNDMTNAFMKGINAPDGIHDRIEFNEYKDPSYWMRRRAVRAFMENLAPIGIVLGTFLAFLVLGYIEVGL